MISGRYIKGNGITPSDALAKFGKSFKTKRISISATQEDLQIHSGVSLTVIKRLEAGKPISTENLVKLLRSIELLPEFLSLIPEPEISLEDEFKQSQEMAATLQRKRASNGRKRMPMLKSYD
ncbi:hypothetical protein CYQ88_03790 [Hydrogenovibrio sp. SC-1]|uniref:hypothetical protein n=1 Tax=Hydrogenovibrio sp. SC-1 TaxID=2065820 RepID=UPI000C7C2D1C|nr:hypothetical protein [Hydrogenovibrio sp. SC-1]PLA75031.1 hypothetical protein CYQ88_03790 [Hydrogenovibrio sp. SC-1]